MNLIWGHSQKCWQICQILASYLLKSVRTLKSFEDFDFSTFTDQTEGDLSSQFWLRHLLKKIFLVRGRCLRLGLYNESDDDEFDDDYGDGDGDNSDGHDYDSDCLIVGTKALVVSILWAL